MHQFLLVFCQIIITTTTNLVRYYGMLIFVYLQYSRGYPTSCIGLVPYTGIDLALFETLKREYVYKNLDNVADRTHVIWKAIPCGIVSTTVAQCVAYPFHLMKFRQQGRSKYPMHRLASSNAIIGKRITNDI